MRIAIGEFAHETNTFCPGVTDLAAFKSTSWSEGAEILSRHRGVRDDLGGMIEAAERLGQVPRGTHDWHKFMTPEEVTGLLADAGLEIVAIEGIAFSPLSGLHLSANKALNYILAARFVTS